MSDPNEFEREKVCYEQNFAQARSLNSQLNQVPALAMTLTGGLWFAAGAIKHLDPMIRFGILLFAGLCDIALALAALRIRDVFSSYLECIKRFSLDGFAKGEPENPKVPRLGKYSMVSIYCTLMVTGGLLSFTGAFSFYWPFAISPWLGGTVLLAVLFGLYCYLFEKRDESGTEKARFDSKWVRILALVVIGAFLLIDIEWQFYFPSALSIWAGIVALATTLCGLYCKVFEKRKGRD